MNSDITQQKAVTILRFLYPLWAIIGMFSLMYVPSKISNAAEIAANELLFRSGIVGSLVTQLLFVAVALLLYKLFKEVNNNQAGLMVVLALIAVPIAMFNEIFKIAALYNPEQTLFFLSLNTQGIIIASIFWGLWLFPLGYLIYKSTYFPKWVGIAVIIAAAGYTLDSFAKLLNYSVLAPVFEVMLFGEMIFIFWIIIRGAKLK